MSASLLRTQKVKKSKIQIFEFLGIQVSIKNDLVFSNKI